MNTYRVWCNDDSKYCVVESTSTPTDCPENGAHTIDAAKTVVLPPSIERADPQRIGLALAPDALYYFDDADKTVDQSGSGYTLSETGTMTDGPGFVPGDRSVYSNVANERLTITHADFCVTGALSIIAIVKILDLSAEGVLVRCGGPGEEEGNNTLYSLDFDASGNLKYFHEYGEGSNLIVTGPLLSCMEWAVIGLTRPTAGTSIKLFWDGAVVKAASGFSAPTGGNVVPCGFGSAPGDGALPIKGYVDSAAMWFSELSEAAVLEETRRIRGVNGG